MTNWQLQINGIVEGTGAQREKLQQLKSLRCELMQNLHVVEGYVDKVDYCIYNLEKGCTRKGE